MSVDDPASTMERLTTRVQGHYGRLRRAWDTHDPDVSLTASGDEGPSAPGPSDPTGRAVERLHTVRINTLRAVARNTLKLGDLVDDIGHLVDDDRYSTEHTRRTIGHLEKLTTEDRAENPIPAAGALDALLAIHRGWWLILHDTVMQLASSPAAWDEARSIVDFIDKRNEHRLEHQLGRIARRAELQIVQPLHEAAGSNRAACSDRHGYGCKNFLPPEQKSGTCRACESRAYRQRKAIAQHS